MVKRPVWDPATEWKPIEINWVRVKITPEDLKRFTTRSDGKGLVQSLAFLLLLAATGTLAYLAFLRQHWVLLTLALYLHGTFYAFFGNALHELTHNTVFASRALNKAMTALYGWLYWPMNPHLYRLSHQGYHHRYTLHQGSDGEDVPNFIQVTPGLVRDLFLRVIHFRALAQNVGRLLTFRPASLGWRGRGFELDSWERFVIAQAEEKKRQEVLSFARFCMVSHILFAALCLAVGQWFLLVLITLAPFYGAGFIGYLAGVHQHTACEANHPDFRISCGDAILDPLSSFLYWRMEYHIEHHMFAAIPCYNLKAFSRFVADQLPPKEWALPRIRKLHAACKTRYGTWDNWREQFGRFKGF